MAAHFVSPLITNKEEVFSRLVYFIASVLYAGPKVTLQQPHTLLFADWGFVNNDRFRSGSDIRQMILVPFFSRQYLGITTYFISGQLLYFKTL